MNVKFDAVEMENRGGKAWLCLRPSEDSLFETRQFVKGFKGDKLFTAEIKRWYEKRSESANAYMWRLLDEIAKAIRTDKISVYREIIKRVGVFRTYYIPSEDAAEFARYWNELGDGWFVEFMETKGNYVTTLAYVGSSKYDRQQMSILVDEVISEAQELGIETRTPDEIASMIDLWGKV